MKKRFFSPFFIVIAAAAGQAGVEDERMNRNGQSNLIRLKDLAPEALTAAVSGLGEPPFRARQIIKWVYQKRVDSFDAMTTMPKTLRGRLAQEFAINKMRQGRPLVSKKGDAVKFTFNLIGSPEYVECVLLYDGKRRTACLSSQLGCALRCVFCATGKMGFIRNLSQEEILGQLIGINDYLALRNDKPVTNIVFMGMGEALSNFERLRTCLEIIMHEDAFNIGGRRITISTAGVVPSIERLIAENLNVGLAISLNAASDCLRSELMPINIVYPIASLVAAAKKYYRMTGRRVTFEYVCIAGMTDTAEAAGALERLLGGFPCKINLIPFNQFGGCQYKKSSERHVLRFNDELHHRGLSATIRKSRGEDIDGACGQLVGGAG
ncbi:MAG: 23S rRNA (adenine(2503)-C(2))-methyltransferase RlmN [Chitinispirillaceae bacterium]|nr:23S rRNA (adenine(2503)-C(2))-methyltransferase RlmN [Chitinispirillaceae bacterium]